MATLRIPVRKASPEKSDLVSDAGEGTLNCTLVRVLCLHQPLFQ